LNIKLLTDTAKVPYRGSAAAAGYDIYADETIMILPGEVSKVHTGIATELPEGTFAGIYPRSGLATKNGLRLANCVAVIDSDYRGEWLVPIYNDSSSPQIISKGDRIAQMVIHKYETVDFNVVDKLNDTIRGAGGFNSTGIR
jgi:dUTP pyrophosphatase